MTRLQGLNFGLSVAEPWSRVLCTTDYDQLHVAQCQLMKRAAFNNQDSDELTSAAPFSVPSTAFQMLGAGASERVLALETRGLGAMALPAS